MIFVSFLDNFRQFLNITRHGQDINLQSVNQSRLLTNEYLVAILTMRKLVGTETYSDIIIVGAMRKEKLGGSINLDTISNKKGLYGLGPESYLTDEILINDGSSYVSKVTSDSTMIVESDI